MRALSLDVCHPLAMGAKGGYAAESRDMKIRSCFEPHFCSLLLHKVLR